MKPIRLLAILFVIAGIAGLAFDRFTYAQETHDAKIGPLELQVKEKKSVDVPTWASAAAIVLGVGMLFVPLKK